MKLQFLRAFVGAGLSFAAGDVAEVNDVVAEKLLRQGDAAVFNARPKRKPADDEEDSGDDKADAGKSPAGDDKGSSDDNPAPAKRGKKKTE